MLLSHNIVQNLPWTNKKEDHIGLAVSEILHNRQKNLLLYVILAAKLLEASRGTLLKVGGGKVDVIPFKIFFGGKWVKTPSPKIV